jgi:Superinfection immunity protein
MLSSVVMLATLVGSIFGICLLFVPTGVAKIRNHPHAHAICLLNLFLGWTLVGWVASLFWSCTTPPLHESAWGQSSATPLFVLAHTRAFFRISSVDASPASASFLNQP